MPENPRHLAFPATDTVPALGQGTWRMAENRRRRHDEIAALRLGLDLGLTLIDTAEMYASGGAEELVGEAIDGRRDDVFLVSKVYPHNATREGAIKACEQSLRRLRTDRLDLYLLHWRGSVPLDRTFAAFEQLKNDGKIRHYGVSNFDVADLEEAVRFTPPSAIATNQILYNLMRRGPEVDLLPWCSARGIPVMAYSPVEQGRLLPKLATLANRRGTTPAQIALAWLLQRPGVITIPKAATPAHVRDNHGALSVHLTVDDLQELDRLFPAPRQKTPLEML
ncbi:MAG: aldo/keto reductase [Verrucomicrobia bacterium]|nr:aldo/keto reductase [Verrucomicrobiota bacterium]